MINISFQDLQHFKTSFTINNLVTYHNHNQKWLYSLPHLSLFLCSLSQYKFPVNPIFLILTLVSISWQMATYLSVPAIIFVYISSAYIITVNYSWPEWQHLCRSTSRSISDFLSYLILHFAFHSSTYVFLLLLGSIINNCL